MASERRPLAILGGGPAGLAVGYFARRFGVPFRLYEQAPRVGGHCATVQHGRFRFDTGAHRVHDRDPVVSAELARLLGRELREVTAPSQIWHGGKMIDFPLSPLNLARALGPWLVGRAALELAATRLQSPGAARTFEQHALRAYGRTLAERFLLNYSAKLWGQPCSELAASAAGARLKGLDVKTLLVEALRGRQHKTGHLEAARFYYPRGGFGRIGERLAEVCGASRIHCDHRVSRLHHRRGRVVAVSFASGATIDVDEVVSTLPLERLVQMLDPAPPPTVSQLAAGLRYRNLVLVALFVARPTITPAATIYVPDREVPFTRVSEPRNRCPEMSPPGQTSLVCELPCDPDDALWGQADAALIERVVEQLSGRLALVRRDEVFDATVRRLSRAYPVLTLEGERRAAEITRYLGRLANLRLAGRNGLFRYSWLHDQLAAGRAEALRQRQRRSRAVAVADRSAQRSSWGLLG